METIIISKELARKCADALVDKHNEIANRGEDSCTLISFRSLYTELCELGFEWLIASAIHPVNEKHLPLFPGVKTNLSWNMSVYGKRNADKLSKALTEKEIENRVERIFDAATGETLRPSQRYMVLAHNPGVESCAFAAQCEAIYNNMAR